MPITENLGKILILLIAIILAILIILRIMEKKLAKKITTKKEKKVDPYKEQIKKINKKNQEQALKDIDTLARNFFTEAFQVKHNEDYSKLKLFFKKKKNIEAQKFCDIIIKSLYSKEKNKKQVQTLISLLEKIIEKNKLISKEKLKKEEIQKTSIFDKLKNIKIPGINKKEINNKQENSSKNKVLN